MRISADLVSFDIANKTVILVNINVAVILNLIPKSFMERKTKKMFTFRQRFKIYVRRKFFHRARSPFLFECRCTYRLSANCYPVQSIGHQTYRQNPRNQCT